MVISKNRRSFTLALDLIVLLVCAVFFTSRCSFPAQSAPDERSIRTPPVTGQAATMAIMNCDSSSVVQSGPDGANRPDGTVEIAALVLGDV